MVKDLGFGGCRPTNVLPNNFPCTRTTTCIFVSYRCASPSHLNQMTLESVPWNQFKCLQLNSIFTTRMIAMVLSGGALTVAILLTTGKPDLKVKSCYNLLRLGTTIVLVFSDRLYDNSTFV